MAEKGDLPSDTVSLPPTYAPSEAYTESPPPAYKKSGMASVRIARIVCFTLLAMTFIIGFFVVTHKWVQNSNCKCAEQFQDESELVQHAALLSRIPSLPNSNLDNNKIEDEIERKEMEEDENFQEQDSVEEEAPLPEQIVPVNESPKDEDEDERVLEEAKNVDLPKNLLLGNPKLAGRNVHCKVERRQRKIAEGIMTQAIIVTCDDEDDDDDDEEDENSDEKLPMPIIPIRPPMSLLSTIMKVLSSRPRSNVDRPEGEPQLLPFPRPPAKGPLPILRPIRGPFPGPISPVLVPLRKIEMRRPMGMNENEEPVRPISIQQIHSARPNENRNPRMNRMFPPRQIIQRPEESGPQIQQLPFPLPNGPIPIRMIRLPARNEEGTEENRVERNEEEENGPLPFPIHPLIRLFPRRRIIRLRPKESNDNMQNEPIPFPLPRGALPIRHSPDEPMPHPMPEASGRALPSPVALPEVRVVRLPFRPQPQQFPEAKVITHMEVRQPKEEDIENRGSQNDIQQTNNQENQSFRPNNKEFGPPKTHSVIANNPRPIFGDEEPEDDSPEPFHQEPITQTQSQPRFVAPPPPRFAREGRTSIFARLNPDAEVIPTNQEDQPENREPVMRRIVIN